MRQMTENTTVAVQHVYLGCKSSKLFPLFYPYCLYVTKQAAERCCFTVGEQLDIVMKCWRLLPNTVSPPNTVEPEQHHGDQEENINQRKYEPCVLIFDFFA